MLNSCNMKRWNLYIYVFFSVSFFIKCSNLPKVKDPTLLIGILARNKAHLLPYFLSYLEKLDYPKNRIALKIYSDNNIDNTIEILKEWIQVEGNKYSIVNFTAEEESKGFEDEDGNDWGPMHFSHVIKLRDEILSWGRRIWADYVFMLDADALIINSNAIKTLISKNKTVVAPMLKSDGMYSNFWAGMSTDYYYLRTDKYKPILNRSKKGCFEVPMIHSAVLVDIRTIESDYLTYDPRNVQKYEGPQDDIITFALSAKQSGIPMYICNDEIYGFITIPLDNNDTIEQDIQQLTNIKIEIINTAEYESIYLTNSMKKFVNVPIKDKLGLGKIYMINLLRRPERRIRMLACFDELGIDAEVFDAIDGRLLNESTLFKWNISLMPEYKDPYHDRPMKMGEVGCFLSHYYIWEKIVTQNIENALILEDDVKFEPYFRKKLIFLLDELQRVKPNWDLVYLGRKALQRDKEFYVEGTNHLSYPSYTYWTIGYLISKNGAKKLIDAKPLEFLIPVDEFLPIMFDQHLRTDWKKYFPNRNLIALSAEPFLIFPTHYTNESGYISDTENSNILMSNNQSNYGVKEEL